MLLPGIKLMYNNNYTSERKEINKLNIHSRKTLTSNNKENVIILAMPLALSVRFPLFPVHGRVPAWDQAVGVWTGDSWAHLWPSQQGRFCSAAWFGFQDKSSLTIWVRVEPKILPRGFSVGISTFKWVEHWFLKMSHSQGAQIPDTYSKSVIQTWQSTLPWIKKEPVIIYEVIWKQ